MDNDESDLLVTTRFRNLLLYRLVPRGQGHRIAKEIGLSYTTIYDLIMLKQSPFRMTKGRNSTVTGEYKDTAIKISNYFGIQIERLFPITLYQLKIPALVERTFNSAIIMPMLEARQQGLLPERVEEHMSKDIDMAKLGENIAKVLLKLTPRQERIICLRYGLNGESEHTLQEIADMFAITPARARQIIIKTESRLRHPGFQRTLRKYYDNLDV